MSINNNSNNSCNPAPLFTVETVPAEIWGHLFTFFDPKLFKMATFTCKVWNQVTQMREVLIARLNEGEMANATLKYLSSGIASVEILTSPSSLLRLYTFLNSLTADIFYQRIIKRYPPLNPNSCNPCIQAWPWQFYLKDPQTLSIRNILTNKKSELKYDKPVTHLACNFDCLVFALTVDRKIEVFNYLQEKPIQTIETLHSKNDPNINTNNFNLDRYGFVVHGDHIFLIHQTHDSEYSYRCEQISISTQVSCSPFTAKHSFSIKSVFDHRLFLIDCKGCTDIFDLNTNTFVHLTDSYNVNTSDLHSKIAGDPLFPKWVCASIPNVLYFFKKGHISNHINIKTDFLSFVIFQNVFIGIRACKEKKKRSYNLYVQSIHPWQLLYYISDVLTRTRAWKADKLRKIISYLPYLSKI